MTHSCSTGYHREPDYGCYYAHRCGCRGCLDGVRDYWAHKRRMEAYGRWRGNLHPADAARGLIAALVDVGATRVWTSRETGVSVVQLWRIEAGRVARVQAGTLAKLRLLAGRVGSGEAVPPGYQQATPDPERMCVSCRTRRRAGAHRECKTCQRQRHAARRGVTA